MYEDNRAGPRENQIGFAWKVIAIQPVTETEVV